MENQQLKRFFQKNQNVIKWTVGIILGLVILGKLSGNDLVFNIATQSIFGGVGTSLSIGFVLFILGLFLIAISPFAGGIPAIAGIPLVITAGILLGFGGLITAIISFFQILGGFGQIIIFGLVGFVIWGILNLLLKKR